MKIKRPINYFFLFISVLLTAFFLQAEQLKKPVAADNYLYWLTSDMRLDAGDAAGANISHDPQITCAGDHVYACWLDYRNGRPDIYFNYSSDRGGTWQASAIRLNRGNTGFSYAPQITCAGDHVYVCWPDSRNGNRDIYFNYSADRGATWQATDMRLDTADPPGKSDSDSPQIACAGDQVYVTWYDSRNGDLDIYFNYSADRGATWQTPDMRLDTGDSAGAHHSHNPRIACAGDHVYVCWADERNMSLDIYFNYSADRGATWQATAICLDTGSSAMHLCLSFSPQISCEDDQVYVAWYDSRNGNGDIYFNFSADRGATWQATDMRLDTGDTPGMSISYEPQIASAGDHVYVCWGDYRNGSSDIYLNYSADRGATWQASDMRLDTGDPPGESNSGSPQIGCEGDHVYVCWRDNRNGSRDIYFNHSADRGVTWQTPDMRLDTGNTGDSYAPQITCNADHVYVCWFDSRNGNEDIYLNATNTVPIAGAGRDMTARTGSECLMDGSSSFDPDNDPLRFSWRFVQKPAGSEAVLDSLRSVRPGFVPDKAGTYRLALTVADPFGAIDRDMVFITAEEFFELTIQSSSGGTTLPAPGTYTHDRGEHVLLTASAAPGFGFSGWSGDAAGSVNPLELIMDRDRTIIANFRALVHSPLDFSGIRITNRSLSQAEYLVKLSWRANPKNTGITAYRIYSGAELIAEVGSSTLEYLQRGVAPSGQLIYSLVAVRVDGCTSEPLEIAVN